MPWALLGAVCAVGLGRQEVCGHALAEAVLCCAALAERKPCALTSLLRWECWLSSGQTSASRCFGLTSLLLKQHLASCMHLFLQTLRGASPVDCAACDTELAGLGSLIWTLCVTVHHVETVIVSE